MYLDTVSPVPVRRGVGPMQHGQAVVEALLVLTVLGSLGVGVVWLAALQDIDLQLQHASRRVAFAQVHQGLDFPGLPKGVDGYLASPGHTWRDRQGAPLLGGSVDADADADAASAPPLIQFRGTGITPRVQAGDPLAGADHWRAELHLGDAGVWRSQVSIQISGGSTTTGALWDFDRLGLHLQRHTAILQGSGAAASDAQVQDRLSASSQAWSRLLSESQRQGQAVQQRLQGVDAAWGRPQPGWDWTRDWMGQVPPRYLQPWSQP